MALWNCKSIDAIGMHLHWIIDDPTISIYEKQEEVLTAERTIESLITIGCTIDDYNEQGHTIISWLIICRQLDEYVIEFIKRIVTKYSADINLKNLEGYTPLMWASIFDRPCAITLLLSLGADPNIEQLPGKTARYFATECDNTSALQSLVHS